MKNNNLYLADFFKNQVKPKLEDTDQIKQFEVMAKAMDEIGVESYYMTPKQILEELEEESKYKEQEWLNFISHKSIATFLERELIKMNKVILRQKIAKAAMASVSTSDIKMIGILKDLIDSADTSDDSVIHYSQFIPLRESASVAEEVKDTRQEVMDIIELFEIDTDYMNIIDAKKAREVELDKMRKYKELDQLASLEAKEEEEIQAEIMTESALYTEIDDIFDDEEE